MPTRLTPFEKSSDSTQEAGELWVDAYVFDVGFDMTRIEEAKEFLAQEGVQVDGERCQHGYDCCGRWYPRAVTWKMEDNRLIGIQNWRQNV